MKFTWQDFEEACKYFQKHLKGDWFDVVIAIQRGGLCLGVALSHLFNIPFVSLSKTIDLVSSKFFVYHCRNRRVLLVDDVSDTGNTLLLVKRLLNLYEPASITVATLHRKPWTKCVPDLCYQETDEWIIYPWEMKE